MHESIKVQGSHELGKKYLSQDENSTSIKVKNVALTGEISEVVQIDGKVTAKGRTVGAGGWGCSRLKEAQKLKNDEECMQNIQNAANLLEMLILKSKNLGIWATYLLSAY